MTDAKLSAAIDDLAETALRVKAERDSLYRENKELSRRLYEILYLIDGMQDIDGNGGPNLFMKIAMAANGEDQP